MHANLYFAYLQKEFGSLIIYKLQPMNKEDI